MCVARKTTVKKMMIKTLLKQPLFCFLINGLANEEFNEACNMPKPLVEMC